MAKIVRDDIDKAHEYGLYIPTKTMFIGDDEDSGISSESAMKAIKNLHILDSHNIEKPINIILQSYGGDVLSGFSIYDAIKSCKSNVNIIATGYCMSMAAIILQAGDYRLMSKSSKMMVHSISLEIPDSHVALAKKWLLDAEQDQQVLEQILLEKIKVVHPKFTLYKVKQMLVIDTILNPQDALSLNLIDEII